MTSNIAALWPDNSLHWVQVRGRPIYDAAGKPLRMTGVSQEVTEQKHAEAALQESERQFRSLADSIPTLCWMARADGHIFWYNRQVVRLHRNVSRRDGGMGLAESPRSGGSSPRS